MKLRKTHKYLIAMFLTAVMFMASLMSFGALGRTQKVQANVNYDENTAYYFSDTIDISIPEETIANKYDNYSIRVLSSYTFKNIFQNQSSAGSIISSLLGCDTIASFESDSFENTQGPCTLIFEFWVWLPNLTVMENLFYDLENFGYKIVLISAFDLQNDFGYTPNVDAYAYIDIIGHFVDYVYGQISQDGFEYGFRNSTIIIDSRFIELDNISYDTNMLNFYDAYINSRLIRRLMDVLAYEGVESLEEYGINLLVHLQGNEFKNLSLGSSDNVTLSEGCKIFNEFETPIYAIGYAPLETDLYNCLIDIQRHKGGIPIYRLKIGPVVPGELIVNDYVESEDHYDEYQERLINLAELLSYV